MPMDMPQITVKPDRQSRKERLLERLGEQARKTGIKKNVLAQQAFREYLNRVENPKPDPFEKIAHMFEVTQRGFELTNKQIAILNERLERLEK